MKRLLFGAAMFAAGVFGADMSSISYIRGGAGIEAFAQSTSPAAPASGGLGNGGAALGAGSSSTKPAPATGDAGSATGSPDAAAKVGAKPADAKAGDAKASDTKAADTKATEGKAAKETDTEAAPEEPAAAAAAVEAAAATDSGDPDAIGTPKVDLPKAGGNGNLGYDISIDVPDFHGIEPQIALNYNSSRKTKYMVTASTLSSMPSKPAGLI